MDIEQSYMVTINVWPNKLVNNTKWSNYCMSDQCHILTEVTKVAFAPIKVDHNFEATKAENMHTHFMVRCTDDVIRRAQAYVHSQLGLPSAPLDRVFKFTMTKVHQDYGEDYCTKEKQLEDPLGKQIEDIPKTNVFKMLAKREQLEDPKS